MLRNTFEEYVKLYTRRAELILANCEFRLNDEFRTTPRLNSIQTNCELRQTPNPQNTMLTPWTYKTKMNALHSSICLRELVTLTLNECSAILEGKDILPPSRLRTLFSKRIIISKIRTPNFGDIIRNESHKA